MSNDSRVQKLLDELFNTHRTPEEVCVAHPELLPEVRERWRQIRRVEADLDVIFPPPEPGASAQAPTQKGAAFPIVPGYELEAILGRGGMGIVFRARDTRLKRLVALKMVLAGEYAGPQERLRFQREAEAVAGLRHPNIVQIHDIGNSDGRPYFTMEHVEAGSLAQKLAGTPQPSRDAASLAATLAVAVQAAHTSGIVHRDLKPANVLLTSDGTPKISDFGLARKVDGETALTCTGVPVGTPSYMAPEQAVGLAVAGPAVDVYALGAILYEMLTGRPPFLAETAAETIQQVISQDPVAPSRLNATVPRDLETICLKCLCKDPGLRYESAAKLADDLNRFLRGDAITARPEGRLARFVRRVRRRPAFSAAVAVCAFLTVALIGSGLWMLSEKAAAAQVVHARERAADDDLNEMANFLKRSAWLEAKAARERAMGRLGDSPPEHFQARLDSGASDLATAATLETIRFDLSNILDGKPNLSQADKDYEALFARLRLGQIGDDPQLVAQRVRASNIANTLVAALDHWSICAQDEHRMVWGLRVVSEADPDPTGWRDRARDPAIRKDPAAVASLIKNARLADQSVSLLVALGMYLKDSKQRLPFLKSVQQAHPADLWANFTLGDALRLAKEPAEALRYYQAATAIRPELAVGYHDIGLTLAAMRRFEEAVFYFRKAIEKDSAPGPPHMGLIAVLSLLKRHDEALVEFKNAFLFRPHAGQVYNLYGQNLEGVGKLDEAMAAHRRAFELNPEIREIQQDLRDILLRRGRLDDARIAWGKALEFKPADHGDWYGYAELCLFLGEVEEYRRARQALLQKFGNVTNPQIAERTARACLLLPAPEAELQKAVALADRAAAVVDRSRYQPIFSSFLFVKGLAEYREGKFDRAIVTMQGDASRALGPAPRLVLAMALHRSGQKAEARKSLALAISSHDWRSHQARDQDGWIYHVLRREAETLMLPNLEALLQGKYQPADNDERMASLGACQFTNRWAAVARLYADAFDAAPNQDLVRYRYSAARAAALAGCSGGEDAAKLGENEREKWRTQARKWLRADLAVWKKFLDKNLSKAPSRDLVRQNLTLWQTEADLAGLREPSELLKLPEDERKDCIAFWDDVRHAIEVSQAK